MEGSARIEIGNADADVARQRRLFHFDNIELRNVSWLCNCGVLNSGINTGCAAVQHYRNVNHQQVTPNTFDSLMMLVAERELKQTMTDNEDLFAQFFNAEITLVSAMTEVERIDHIQELEAVAFEAKARLTAAKSHQRDKAANKRLGGEWSVTPVEPDPNVTDTINRVQLRKKRMTKLDSTREALEKIGYDKKTIDTMMSAMMKAAANQADAKSTQIERDRDNGDASGKAVTKPITKPNTPSTDAVLEPTQWKTEADSAQAEGKALVEAQNQPIRTVVQQDVPIQKSNGGFAGKSNGTIDLSTLKFK